MHKNTKPLAQMSENDKIKLHDCVITYHYTRRDIVPTA